jgi:DNA-binding response OmpR family regulator
MVVMRGDKLSTAIKALVSGQAIVMFTSKAESLNSSNARFEGVDLIIAKPFLFQELRQAFADLSTQPRDQKPGTRSTRRTKL